MAARYKIEVVVLTSTTMAKRIESNEFDLIIEKAPTLGKDATKNSNSGSYFLRYEELSSMARKYESTVASLSLSTFKTL